MGAVSTMYLAVKQFWHTLKGCQFRIFTDHCPLIFALHSKADIYTPWKTRHLEEFIAQFTADIHDKCSRHLLCLPLNSLSLQTNINLHPLAKDQPRLETVDISSPAFETYNFKYFPIPTSDTQNLFVLSFRTNGLH